MYKQDNTPRLQSACVLAHGVSYRGDGTATHVKPGAEVDLLTILETTRRWFAPQSTVVVDGHGIGAYTGQSERVRAAGWKHSAISAWTLFHTEDGRTVSLGLRAAMGPAHLGILFDRDTDPGALAIILDRYQKYTGTAWRGTFATTACAGIRSSWGNDRYQPLWNESRKGPGHAVGPMVWSRDLGQWERQWGFVHTFDARSAYLGAAISADLPWSELHHVGPQPFDEGSPGYWHLQLDNETLQLIHEPGRPPVLPPSRVKDGCVWVTTPYAKLLRELGDRCDVIDSWTARAGQRPDGSRLHPAGSRILRTWGGQMRDARAAVEAMPIGPLRTVLLKAVKRTYTDATGAMQREIGGKGMRVHRAIWGHTVIDLWRATLYRTTIRVRDSAGVWPIAIRTDSLTYADCTDDPRPLLAELAGARRAKVGPTGLGSWNHQSVVTTEEWCDAHPARKVKANA